MSVKYFYIFCTSDGHYEVGLTLLSTIFRNILSVLHTVSGQALFWAVQLFSASKMHLSPPPPPRWLRLLCILRQLKRKRKLVALLLLSYRCIDTVLWLFLTVWWVGQQCVIVVFPDYTHLRFIVCTIHRNNMSL